MLAFDRHRVETALSEEGLAGRDYLEKILQVAYDIPVIPTPVLTRVLTEAIDASIGDIENPGPFDAQAWPDVLFEVVRPLVRNMRDVRRYVASLHGTLVSLEGRVAMVDVLGLEAVRVFLPDAFKALIAAQEGLTTPSPMGIYGQEPPRLKASIEEFLRATGDHSDVVRATVTRLFPAGRRHIENMNYGAEWQKRWLRERRVAHPDLLKLYLERVIGDRLEAFGLAEQAFAILDDENALKQFFDSLDGAQLADAISALEVYEDGFPVSAVEPAATVLLNQLGRVPERPGGFLTMSADLIVGRVVLRLLRRIDPSELDAVVRRMLPKVEKLSDRLELITLVGHRENSGHKLISEEAAAELESELRSQVRAADAESLASEHDLLRLLIWTKSSAEPTEPAVDVPQERRVDVRLLRASLTETQSRSLDSRAVARRPELHWNTLVEVVGGEAAVQGMIDRIGAVSDDAEVEGALRLAKKYLGGWRPARND
jgi:predicted KAP-like P-loop ATPase